MGGSFIGYELAEGVSFRKKAKLTWIMRGPWFLRYVLDEEGGQLCRQLGEAQGRRVHHIGRGAEVQPEERPVHGRDRQRHHVDFDVLTYGVGLDYYTEPVGGTGIELNKGIVTDASCKRRRQTCTPPATFASSTT